MSDWNASIIAEFREHGGKVGGNFEGAPLLLLHTKGRRTGEERVNPMMYLEQEGRLFVFASKAGADTDPDWYRNLVAHPDVTAEIGTEELAFQATPLEGDDRDRVYHDQAARYPGFQEYQDKTSRVIPVVELVRS